MSSAPAQTQTMTLFDWHAQMVENTANTLAFWIDKTRDDRLAWHPAMEGSAQTRNALQLAAECAAVNRSAAALLRGEEGHYDERTYGDRHACTEDLKASGKELAQAIRALDDEALTRLYDTKFGPMPGAMLMQIALGNMYYHGGQVNLIQLLYGDPKFYVPGVD